MILAATTSRQTKGQGLGAVFPRNFRGRGLRGRGFTVLEVMLAMGVFVIGFVAVLTLFPAAIALQKQTMDDLEVQRAVRDATNLLRGRPWEMSDIRSASGWPAIGSGQIDNLHRLYAPLSYNLAVNWSVMDRSFPRQPIAGGVSPGLNYRAIDGSDARYYWVPLIKRTKIDDVAGPDDWIVYLMVLRRDVSPAEANAASGGTPRVRYDANQPGLYRMRHVVANAPEGVTGVTRDPDFVPTLMRRHLMPWPTSTNPTQRLNRMTFQQAGSNLIDASDTSDGRAGLLIKGGDLVLASNGVVYRVTAAHDGGDWIMVSPDIVPDQVVPNQTFAQGLPTEIWFAPPPSRLDEASGNYRVDTSAPSPLVRVEVVKGAIR